jgi:hypothetical protein
VGSGEGEHAPSGVRGCGVAAGRGFLNSPITWCRAATCAGVAAGVLAFAAIAYEDLLARNEHHLACLRASADVTYTTRAEATVDPAHAREGGRHTDP